MKIKNLSRSKGMAVIEILIVLAIIAIVAILLTKANPRGYTNWMGQRSYQSTSTSGNTYSPIYTPPNPPSSTNTVPVITLYGDNPYNLFHPGMVISCDSPNGCPPRTDVYKELGYKAYDKEDGDITTRVVVTDEINDTAFMGPCNKWNKKYTVKDSTGNISIVRREINECFGA